MSFQQGLSGLNAASKNLDVIGHNIANSGTTGFKASRAEFAELVASAIGSSGGTNAGIGVEVADVSQQFNQGNLSVTGNSLDVAINGNGFFTLQQTDGSRAYTRAGNFKLDQGTGNVITNNGAQVMGYALDPTTGLRTSSTLVPMQFPTAAPIPAKQTTKIKTELNLDARAADAVGDPTATPPVPATPRSTYGTSINVYDSQGVATPLNVYFEKNGSNTWDIYDRLDNPTSTPPVVGKPVGQITMDGNGKITGMTQPKAGSAVDANGSPTEFQTWFRDTDGKMKQADVTGTWAYTTNPATTPPTVTSAKLTLGTPGTATDAPTTFAFDLNLSVDPSKANPNSPPQPFNVALNLKDVTQFGSKFAVSDLTQDGYTAGQLTGINISGDGTIMTSYSNGITRPEGQLALSSFRNTQGLAAVGNNNWVATFESGQAVLGTPTDGNFGTLRSGALEDSNVDLTAELVNMMTAQRAYQANAQTIKTQDQIMSTLVNLR